MIDLSKAHDSRAAQFKRLPRAALDSKARNGTTDIAIVENMLATSISVALRNFLILVGALILLVFVSPRLTGLVLLTFPFPAWATRKSEVGRKPLVDEVFRGFTDD